MRRRPHGLCCRAAALLALTAAGCGAPTGTISGKVLYQGKPLPGGYVNYMSQEGSVTKSCAIGPDGGYTVSGVPVGAAKITVQGILAPPRSAWMKVPGRDIPEGAGRPAVYVPPQYGNTDQSGLTWDVVGGGQKHDIELK